MSVTATASPLLVLVKKNLGDRTFEKRKVAVDELTETIKKLVIQKQSAEIEAIIECINTDFIKSANSNARKGGILALAGIAVGLSDNIKPYLDNLITPVIHTVEDPDPRVRYYACESLYNIIRITGHESLEYFNNLFDCLCRLFPDIDMDVKNGSRVLDELLKQYVTQYDNFNIQSFIPLLNKYYSMGNAYVRRLLLSWIKIFDSIPSIDMTDYLPEYLGGILDMLDDSHIEIRQEADSILNDLLDQLKTTNVKEIEYNNILRIVVNHCVANDKFIRSTALHWLNELLNLGKEILLSDTYLILDTLFQRMNDVDEISNLSLETHQMLLNIINNTEMSLDYGPIIDRLIAELANTVIPSRIASLQTLSILLIRKTINPIEYLNQIVPPLLKTLSDEDDQVIMKDLDVLIIIAKINDQLEPILMNVLNLFETDRNLLKIRGPLIIRTFSLHLNSITVYKTLSRILLKFTDLNFVDHMIHSLNIIMMTAPELHLIRDALKITTTTTETTTSDKSNEDIFWNIYSTWCYNPISLFSLCILSQKYYLSYNLIQYYGNIEPNINFLLQIDRFIQLLESPIFVHVRLSLLNESSNNFQYLIKSLYGLLMILPQSNTYHTLKERLQCITTMHLSLGSANHIVPYEEDISKYINHFNEVQKLLKEWRVTHPDNPLPK